MEKELESISGEGSPDMVVVLLVFCGFLVVVVWCVFKYYFHRHHSLQLSDDTRQGRCILVLHDSSYVLLCFLRPCTQV